MRKICSLWLAHLCVGWRPEWMRMATYQLSPISMAQLSGMRDQALRGLRLRRSGAQSPRSARTGPCQPSCGGSLASWPASVPFSSRSSSKGSLSWTGPLYGAASRASLGRLFRRRFATRRSIGKPFADCATHCFCGSLRIIDAELSAVVMAKIELRQIAMQMLFAHVEIAAIDIALKDRREVFDGIGVSVAANIFVHTVSYRFVAGELSADLLIAPRFIGAEM